jgi:amino acid adenylation domain-containing protein
LHGLLREAARLRPGHVAVEDLPEGAITYGDLDALSDRVRDRLHRLGVGPGDRVGLFVPKSIDAVAAIYGIMKAGAAYVPVDPKAPAWRAAFVLHDCVVRALVVDAALEPAWRLEAQKLGGTLPATLVLDGAGGGEPLRRCLDAVDRARPAVPAEPPDEPDAVAYVLYTSGSTGQPKGVVHSHRNALAFVEWCLEVFEPGEDDRFSSHAPFHFDLSIFDLYVPVACAATVVLIGTEPGKEPVALARLIAERRLTVWYSTPSVLTLLSQFGRIGQCDLSRLRLVLFAGEVFPIKHLRAVVGLLPGRRWFNLYGPTETNVCTFHEVPGTVPEERVTPYPIGRVCSNYRARVVGPEAHDVARGVEGELLIAGTGVMLGYWNRPELTARVFVDSSDALRWYRTGDIVTEDEEGVFTFVGRRDRMVKRRGHRVELGEVEAGLYRHPDVAEAAVVAVSDEEGGVRLVAYLTLHEGRPRSVIAMKRFCAETLPAAHIPDTFIFCDALPRTSTDKVDYQRLPELA